MNASNVDRVQPKAPAIVIPAPRIVVPPRVWRGLAAFSTMVLLVATSTVFIGRAFGGAPSPVSSPPSPSTLPRTTPDPSLPEQPEVEIVTLEGEQESDRQRVAFGMTVGAGWLTTSGSGLGTTTADFSLIVDVGLGSGGARVPWTVQGFVGFALPYTALGETRNYPDRFTSFGGRMVYRAIDGFFRQRWASLGGGLVWTDWGKSGGEKGDLSPAGLLEAGFGFHEWTLRAARLGIGLRVPVEVSAHPGVGAIGFFYGSLGVGN